MLKSQRQKVIVERLQREGAVRVTELAQALEVDPVTVRRDLAALERRGQLRRVHGGAVVREGNGPPSRATGQPGRIAEAAAKFIPDEGVLFLGPGALTVEVVPFLRAHQQLTVITNALDAAWSLARHHPHPLHVLGGQVGADYGLYGDPEALQRLRADVIILAADGLDAERGLTQDDREAAAFTRTLFGLSAEIIVLLDPERLGRTGALFVAPASEIDVLVTGRAANNALLWDLSELGIRIVLA